MARERRRDAPPLEELPRRVERHARRRVECRPLAEDLMRRDAPTRGRAPAQRRQAPPSTFCSSRTLPGHECRQSAAIASGPSDGALVRVGQHLPPERLRQQRHVLQRDRAAAAPNADDRQPKQQVFAEAPAAHGLGERRVRRRDDAHVDGARRVLADAPDLALLQHAQQLGLRARRQLADLVEKQRAAVRLLEETRTRAPTAPVNAPRA